MRYYVDLTPKVPIVARGRLRMLIRTNPHGIRSRHVVHNLGKRRMAWLREEGLIG